MSALAAPALLLAVAVLVGGSRPGRGRISALTEPVRVGPDADESPLRMRWIATGGIAAGAVGALVGGPALAVAAAALASGGLFAVARRGARRPRDDDPAELAAGWELLAVCLQSGLPVAVAVEAAASRLTGPTGARLRRIAGLLELGADPADAWRDSGEHPALAVFGRAARRSAATGTGIAQVARTEAARLRAELVDTARARAQRAGVLITGPLGLCFLPAFLVLGIAPVVIGLAGQALAQW